ncbi:MAG: hypothetical protein HYT76_07475 [Deltaproteobacteria bacterium]|nr:hypothetical protein [Deltaproteobacteria bacterium]
MSTEIFCHYENFNPLNQEEYYLSKTVVGLANKILCEQVDRFLQPGESIPIAPLNNKKLQNTWASFIESKRNPSTYQKFGAEEDAEKTLKRLQKYNANGDDQVTYEEIVDGLKLEIQEASVPLSSVEGMLDKLVAERAESFRALSTLYLFAKNPKKKIEAKREYTPKFARPAAGAIWLSGAIMTYAVPIRYALWPICSLISWRTSLASETSWLVTRWLRQTPFVWPLMRWPSLIRVGGLVPLSIGAILLTTGVLYAGAMGLNYLFSRGNEENSFLKKIGKNKAEPFFTGLVEKATSLIPD